MSHNRICISLAVTVLAALGLSACHDEYDLDIAPPTGMEVSPFTRAAQKDAMTLKDFRRSYGVGFSYDGIWGQPCNLRDALAAELDTLRTQRRQLLQEAHQQAEALVANTRREMENLIRDIREQAKKGKAQETQEPDYEAIRKGIAEKERKLKAGLKIHAVKQKHPLTPAELAVGLRVWVEKMQDHGIIESISAKGNKVVVSINGIAVTLNANELERNRDGIDKAPDEPVIKVFRPRTTAQSHAEINLIGMRVEDALNELAPFIDRSVLLHMPELRIVHGFGTGRLRSGIHQWLRNNPSVKSFHLGQDGKDPGGGGCTIVTLN